MSGTLFVVATPIGNLEDISLRALRVLREVAVIAAEDTRRTAKLLGHHGIATRTVSFHAHNIRARLPHLMGRLEAGENVAVVTDAGTPGVSDPGLELVHACIESGINVDPIPGASAPLTALVGSGFPVVPFTMFGFPPDRSKARIEWFAELASVAHTFSFFEAPHRIQASLTGLAKILGERQIVVAREMTKIHQEFVRGTAATLAEHFSSPRGEFTIVVSPLDKRSINSDIELSDKVISDEFWRIANSVGGPRRDIINQVAEAYGKSAKEVYSAVERIKKLGV